MKLRGIKDDYNIGLDMGTGSVGWAVTNGKGELTYFKNKPTWGSRLFDSAQPASVARLNRSQRRRYVRRRWRLNLLQSLFEDEIKKVDPEFFIRLRQSRLLKEDRNQQYETNYNFPLFNKEHPLVIDGEKLDERGYYKKFPTIYHLRKWLMETDGQADIRLIYLACHNIVKHRGNFLRQDEKKLSAKNANTEQALKNLFAGTEDNPCVLQAWCETKDYEYAKPAISKVKDILANEKLPASQKASDIAALAFVAIPDDQKASKDCNKAIAQAMVGLSAEFKNIFGECSAEKTKFKLSDDEATDAMREGGCPDDSYDLFEAICGVYSAYVLQGLLSKAPGKTISCNMVVRYEQYAKDLKLLKSLVREYAPDKYNHFFRGATYPGTDIYDASKASGYTKYDLGTQKMSYEDFAKEVEKLLKDTSAAQDKRYQDMMAAFDKQDFLRRLKTSDNGSIYYQLHLEEMDAILEGQSKFYPFLKADRDKIESLVSFRIPYYVGPLQAKNAATDAHGKQRFAWAERKAGQENVAITPWNWDQVIDRNKAAETFITRMTGNCTYLQGEDVLPKCSLLYEEYCVLNELNGARMTLDGDDWKRFDTAQREGIIQDLFMHYRTVTYKKVQEWLEREENLTGARVQGGQGETGFESKLSSYIFFCKDVFKVDKLNKADYPAIEEIILWNTLFEDRKILKERLENTYGSRGNGFLSDEQIKVICKKRFTGWGRLSKKLLTGVRITADNGAKYSIMDVLREGNPLSGERMRTMVFMEALHDEKLGFQKRVDAINKAYFEENSDSIGINELPGSPAIRRSINQAIRIVDEIASIAGKEPANIFIEVTRDDEDPRQKGRRTKKRYDSLKEALEVFKKEDPQIWKELNEHSSNDLDERLTLYFMQRGKCMYSGRPLDINKLSSGDYEVDHIIPRSYIKDDSLDNKALVYRSENQSKTDAMLIDAKIRQRMSSYWRMLHDAKLTSDKKFNNLMRSQVNDKMLKGFIARQLVETSQMVKLVQSLLAARYPETKIIPVKANMSHDLREAVGLPKCREANDFHHAHDAYLACRVGEFIQLRYPSIYENPVGMAHVIKARARQEAQEFNKNHNVIGTSGFVVNGFTNPFFDKETGEVYWDADAECESLRRSLNFKQCYISRMPVEDTGAFWKATVYSPRDSKMGKNLSLALKKNLDPQKYGGYSTEQFAYFFIYLAEDRRGERVCRFAQVPTWLAAHAKADESLLMTYASHLAQEDNLIFKTVLYPRILKKQLLEVDSDRLIITGASELRNGTELAFDLQTYCKLTHLLSNKQNLEMESLEASSLDTLNTVISTSEKCGFKLGKQLKLNERVGALNETSHEERINLIKGLLAIYNGANRVVDISSIGGSKNAGAMVTNISKLLSSREVSVYLVDQSVTGMFERRTRIGL